MNLFRSKTTTPLARDSISRSPLRYGLFLISLALAWFALSPTAQAQLSPAPDGGYPNDTTAEGTDALFSLTTGTDNTAIGFNALFSNTTGDSNTATGSQALVSNSTGVRNTANGFAALNSNTTGEMNTATGRAALVNNTTGNNNIDLGNLGVAAEANTIRIGTQGTQTNAYLAGIYQTNIARGLVVKVDSDGHLGTVGSSERFKDEIKPMNKASEAILGLKPVTFHYKKELDPDGTPQFGLVAEEVEKVNPDLVVRDADGKIYTVRYEAVNAMLLNEFLKNYRIDQDQAGKLQEQDATIAQLKTSIRQQQKQIEALTAGLQKVSEQIEVGRSTPQLAGNTR